MRDERAHVGRGQYTPKRICFQRASSIGSSSLNSWATRLAIVDTYDEAMFLTSFLLEDSPHQQAILTGNKSRK